MRNGRGIMKSKMIKEDKTMKTMLVEKLNLVMGESPFSHCQTTEDICLTIQDLTLKELQTNPELTQLGQALYAKERLAYMVNQEEKAELLQSLYQTGELLPHLIEIEKMAQEMMEREIEAQMPTWGLTEELKQADPIKWAGLLNNLQKAIQEAIRLELIQV
ncbi:TPA: TnpV protein [Streptococcus suis]